MLGDSDVESLDPNTNVRIFTRTKQHPEHYIFVRVNISGIEVLFDNVWRCYEVVSRSECLPSSHANTDSRLIDTLVAVRANEDKRI